MASLIKYYIYTSIRDWHFERFLLFIRENDGLAHRHYQKYIKWQSIAAPYVKKYKSTR